MLNGKQIFVSNFQLCCNQFPSRNVNLKFSWWIKGKKSGCDPQNSELDRSELDLIDEDMDRFLPGFVRFMPFLYFLDNAMLKVFTYQSQMEKVQNIFFKNCSAKINEKLTDVLKRVTRDFTTAFGTINNVQ